MLSDLTRCVRAVTTFVRRAAKAVVRVLDQRVRTAWVQHRARVSTNTAYATATVAVLGGLLGLIPARDVLAAMAAAALGILVNSGRRSNGPHDLAVDPWDRA